MKTSQAIASLLLACGVIACSPALAGGTDPRLACAVYKAKVRQWKTDLTRATTASPGSPQREYENLEAIKAAMGEVLLFLGHTAKQVQEMRGWDVGGKQSQAYFFRNGSRIPRSTSPYQVEQDRGLMGKESQAVAFCEGLGIGIRAQ